jgi:hypothetical protein
MGDHTAIVTGANHGLEAAWVADSFAGAGADRLGRSLRPVTEATWGQQFRVDAMAPALMIGEFARPSSPAT